MTNKQEMQRSPAHPKCSKLKSFFQKVQQAWNSSKIKGVLTYYTSTPWYIYAILILITIVCVVLSCCLTPGGSWHNFYTNIAYGLVASLIVAILTDISATKRQRNIDKKVFLRVNDELKSRCTDLPLDLNIAVYECCGYNIECKYPFSEWLNLLFNISNLSEEEQGKHLDEIGFFLQTIADIEKLVWQLEEIIKLQYYNENFSETYEKRIKKLRSACRSALANYKHGKIDGCKTIIEDRIIPVISELFVDTSNDFQRKYRAEDYIGEGEYNNEATNV
jgi:hypothetical protein